MNKIFYVIIGALVGYYIAKNRMEKNLAAQAKKIADETTNMVSEAVDKALAHAETTGMSLSDVRGVLNGSAEIKQ